MIKPSLALITGASSGLGESFAKKLASRGVHLILVARRGDRLATLSQTLREKFGVTVDTITLDLCEPTAPKEILRFIEEKNLTVDLLINNAGTGPYRSFLATPWLEHKRVIDLNLLALTQLSQLFALHMVKHGRPSSILNVSSVAAFNPVPKYAVYASTKTYVRTFSEILRYELKHTNVSVTCLCPGGTATEFLEKNNQLLKRNVLMSADTVTDVGLRDAILGKALSIPGIMNKLTCVVATLLPNSWNLFLAEKAMGLAVAERDV